MTKTKEKQTLNEIFGDIKPVGEFSSSVLTIIMGDTGSGKTTLASTASEVGTCLLINFENRVSHIKESETLRILPRAKGEFRQDTRCTYEVFKLIVADVETKFKVNYIIIDTLDEMFTAFHTGMLQSGEITDRYFGRPDVYQKMWEMFKRLKDTGCNIICTAQAVRDSSFNIIDLAIPANLKSKIRQSIDNIFYYKSTDNDCRAIKLKPDSQTSCKLTAPMDKYNLVPKEITNPDWKMIQEIIG